MARHSRAAESVCMRDDLKASDEAIRPPRWADALLRVFLKPDEAETAAGDLIEAYRDSIYPERGSWQADLWFVRQVAGYILRTGETNLRNWVLAGLTLCVLTIVY